MSKKRKIALLVIIISILSISISVTTILNNSVKLKRASYKMPATELKSKAWQEVFRKDPAIDSFKVLNTGSVKVPLEGMLNITKLSKNHGLAETIWVDVFVFLFHHTEKGWFMIDAGLDSSFQAEGNIKGFLASNYIMESKQNQDQNIANQLNRLKKGIQGIFFTHLHGDHTAGLPELPDSLPKYAGKGDKYLDIPLLYNPNHLTSNSEIIEIDWSQGIKKAPFNSVIDIFGDGSLLAIHTPGHSKSHLSYLLITAEGPKLLTGDASHTKYGFTNNIEPGWVHDQQAAENSLGQLVKFHEMFPSIEIIYGHQR